MKFSIILARNIRYTFETITNIKFYNEILLDLNPAVLMTTNPLGKSKSLAEKLAWLVLVGLVVNEEHCKLCCNMRMFTDRGFSLPSSPNKIRVQFWGQFLKESELKKISSSKIKCLNLVFLFNFHNNLIIIFKIYGIQHKITKNLIKRF